MNNLASAWFNRSSVDFHLYRDSGCRGPRFTAYPGARSGQMSAYWGNGLSSICGGAGCP